MGWLSEEHLEKHEGYLIALQDEGSGLRELRYETHRDAPERPVTILQVGCSCGWRSQRLNAPTGTVWYPYSVGLPRHEREGASLAAAFTTFEDRARALWREHCESPLLREVVSEGWR